MKRLISMILLCLMLALALTSCEGDLEIEDCEWGLRYGLHHSDSGYAAVAVSAEMSWTYPGAAVLDVRLVARNGKLTIADFTNGKTYEGTYQVVSRNPDGSTDYRIVIGDTEGRGVTAMTTYYEGGSEPTLPIALGNYSMYFYALEN